jgi:hypothetical protein
MFQFLCVLLPNWPGMLGLKRESDLIAFPAPVSTMAPGVASRLEGCADVVPELFHLKMLQSRSSHDLRLRKMTGFPLLSHIA